MSCIYYMCCKIYDNANGLTDNTNVFTAVKKHCQNVKVEILDVLLLQCGRYYSCIVKVMSVKMISMKLFCTL